MNKIVAFACAGLSLALSSPALALYVNDRVNTLDLTGNEVLETGPNADVAYLYLNDQTVLNHNGGSVSWAYLYDDAQANVAAVQSWLFAWDRAQVNVAASAELSWLTLFDETRATINGGTLAYVRLNDQAEVTFDFSEGGTLSHLQFFRGGGEATFSGYDLRTSGSVLYYKDRFGTGYSLQVSSYSCGDGEGCYSDDVDLNGFDRLKLVNLGSIGDPNPPVPGVPAPGVPEPATWLVMMLGFGLTGAAIRQRRNRNDILLPLKQD